MPGPQPGRPGRAGRYTPGTMAKTEERPQVPVRTVEERIEELRKRKAAMLDAHRKEAIRKQHERGKLSARERLELLLDAESFQETDPFAVHRSHDFGMERNRPAGDGVVTGHGTIDGRKVFVASQDFTVFGARSARCTPRRSARSWIWPCRPAHRSSS